MAENLPCAPKRAGIHSPREDRALTNGKKKSKYSWWILETGEYGGSASAISAPSPRPALKEKTSRRRQTCSFTSGCVGRDPERNANGTPGSAAHKDPRSLGTRKDLNPLRGNKAARCPPAASGAAMEYCRGRRLKSGNTAEGRGFRIPASKTWSRTLASGR